MPRWVRKTFSIDKDTLKLLESLKKEKGKSYNQLLKELSLKEKLKKKKKKVEDGLINMVFDLLNE